MQMSIFKYSAFWFVWEEAKINTETMQTHRKDQEGKALTDLKKLLTFLVEVNEVYYSHFPHVGKYSLLITGINADNEVCCALQGLCATGHRSLCAWVHFYWLPEKKTFSS